MVAGFKMAARSVRSYRKDVHAGSRPRLGGRLRRAAESYSERLRRLHSEMGDGREDDDLGLDTRRLTCTGGWLEFGRRVCDVLHEGGVRSFETFERRIRASEGTGR